MSLQRTFVLKDLPTKLLLITSGLLHCPCARLTPISQLQRITELSVEFIGTNMQSADLFNATTHTERVFSRISIMGEYIHHHSPIIT